jgi:hypothetical protein
LDAIRETDQREIKELQLRMWIFVDIYTKLLANMSKFSWSKRGKEFIKVLSTYEGFEAGGGCRILIREGNYRIVIAY